MKERTDQTEARLEQGVEKVDCCLKMRYTMLLVLLVYVATTIHTSWGTEGVLLDLTGTFKIKDMHDASWLELTGPTA